MTPTLLVDGKADAPATLLFAHGAGAPMDSAAMAAASAALVAEGIRVVRFEFSYMAARRGGTRRPPPKAEKLVPEYLDAVEALGTVDRKLFIGGKSMGGRVASMVVDELMASDRVAGLVCLGYPFHPPGKPEQVRTAHLMTLKAPALIVQGTRDIFGSRQEVDQYQLSSSITMAWLDDGDHDLKPRKTVSGFSASDHLRSMAATTRDWMSRVGA